MSPIFAALLIAFALMIAALFGAQSLLRPVGIVIGCLMAGMGLALATNLLGSAEHSAEQAAVARQRCRLLAPEYTTSVWYPRLFGAFMVLVGLGFAYQAAFSAHF
jgi:hypothetical protein